LYEDEVKIGEDRRAELKERSTEREHETAREKKQIRLFFPLFECFTFMLPSWPVIGNSLKSYQRPESKQVKSMVKFISGYRTYTKKKIWIL